jgi:MoaA/NifB/PqqE/SkfB family radical SAM enzyme
MTAFATIDPAGNVTQRPSTSLSSAPRFTAPRFPTLRVVSANPRMLLVRPAASTFMARYMRRFPARRFGDNLILHSHLPPLTGKAYSRFVDHHLVGRKPGPSHAQIGLTNACPQNCEYCYNKHRTGTRMDTPTILQAVDDLREAGVCWLGLTGGEPLLNRDIIDITAHASPDMAVKLFTTGVGLTPSLARDLAAAGVFSVCVSLDHWEADRHNASRRYPRAFQEAIEAIRVLKEVSGLHVSVSSVLSRSMIQTGQTEQLLGFLESLGVDEAWLSELKPSVEDFWSDDLVISEQDRLRLVRLQDAYNREARATGGMIVNYLGHFEGAENFGCNAGCKMVYIDAFGEVSPCVFLPFSFGSVRQKPLEDILADMRGYFPGESRCFINKNYRLLREAGSSALPLDREHSVAALERAAFGPLSEFNRRLKAPKASLATRWAGPVASQPDLPPVRAAADTTPLDARRPAA